MRHIVNRISFLWVTSTTIFLFLRLLSYTFTYSLSVRSSWVKSLILRYDKPKEIDVNLLGNRSIILFRIQDIGILYEVFQNHTYKIKGTFQEGTYVDLGAHIGLATLYSYLSNQDYTSYLAVEPDAENFKMLKFNTKNIPNLAIENIAISSEDGISYIRKQGFSHNVVILPSGKSEDSIKTLKLSSIVKNHHINSIKLLKIDVEGYEKYILDNSTVTWPDMVQNLIIELHGDANRMLFKKFIANFNLEIISMGPDIAYAKK